MNPTSASAPTLSARVSPRLSYALAHNRLPFVHDVTIDNPGAAQEGAVLRVEVTDDTTTLSEEFSSLVDLAPGGRTELGALDLRLSPTAMHSVEEGRSGQVTLTLARGDEILATSTHPVQVDAARHWIMSPLVVGLELLPSFVLPNDPAVAELVSEAGDLLAARTGSPSTEGYQSGPDRVDAIVDAIFSAAQARGIRYSNPPASWGTDGQKVRTPSEVFDGRVGTCLDTTVALAAALEHVGINSLLWLVDGHAFLGYWRYENALDAVAETELDEVVNLIDLGAVHLVETTMCTARDEPVRFADTHRPPYVDYLSGDLSRALGVVDVMRARQHKILPLPARRSRGDGGVDVHEYKAPVWSESKPDYHAERAHDQADDASPLPARVQRWKNALLDLSLRNKLINFRERQAIQLTVPDGRLGAIEDLVNAGRKLHLVAADKVGTLESARGARYGSDLPREVLDELLVRRETAFCSLTEATYLTRMRSLAHKARTVVEETGANNLYLALGSLVWDIEGKALRSPLILIPVNLATRGRNAAYTVELDESGASTPNFCLLEKLKQVHGLTIPGLANPTYDDSGIDLDAAFRATREAIAGRGLPYRVEETADLAILQFAKFRLWKDLDENWQGLLQNPLVRHLVETPTDPFDDPVAAAGGDAALDDLDALCPIPADSSQLAAVADAVAGRTFVLEGPPGTGKSQTITNLLTRAVAAGKRVLFVAEKRAALDVVASRLESVGMGPFALDLHDKASKPAVIRQQIRAALDHAVAVDTQGLDADSEDLRSSRRVLSRYADRLHDTNASQLSLYTARTELLSLGEGPVLAVDDHLVASEDSASRLRAARDALRTLPDSADRTHPSPHHPWGFIESAPARPLDRARVADSAGLLDDAISRLRTHQPAPALLAVLSTPEALSAAGDLLTAPPHVDLAVLDEVRTPRWSSATDDLMRDINVFVNTPHAVLQVIVPEALGLPLADIDAAARTAASSGFFGRKKRLLAVLEQMQPGVRAGTVVKPKQGVELVGAAVALREALDALIQRANSIPGIELSPLWNPFVTDRDAVTSQVSALHSWAVAVGDGENATVLREAFASEARRHDLGSTLVEIAHAVTGVSDATAVPIESLVSWAPAGIVPQWETTATRRGRGREAERTLSAWLAFLDEIEPLRVLGLHEAHRALRDGEVDADDASRALARGIAAASLEERARTHGLDEFLASSHERQIGRYTEAAGKVRAHLTTQIPYEVLGARGFDVASGRGQIGELQRELSKQRRGLGVRALLEKYGDLITTLMPCVLVSPDSVARFFAVGSQTFDMVVFDEASQIRVADAVGAMGRARSVVVVGDSKQMPPTSFAESTLDDGTEEAMGVPQDEESILRESVLARVPSRWLSWHYRSQDESLIAFSNRRYYENRLSSFPAPTGGTADARRRGLGVRLERVDGTFHRGAAGKLLRTNPVEAEAIVADVRHRFAASPDHAPSVGVVTFNQQQRAYIEALLRDCGDERLIEAVDNRGADGLFVKNLENVQGDERDTVLFSVAFSTNAHGVLPLNFGPLNLEGGEKRLNVAITRARREVVLYCSFDPAQLRADETQSQGIKDLRAYLEMAAAGDDATRASGRGLTDRHRDDLAEALQDRGVSVRRGVGLSDFRIDLVLARADQPDQPRVALLLDGPEWRARGTVSDRDGLPSTVLTRMLRWPRVERVWLPQWLSDREGVLARLEKAVDAVPEPMEEPVPLPPRPLAQPPSDPARPARVAAATLAAAPSAPAPPSRLPTEMPFTGWTSMPRGSREVLDRLPAAASTTRVRKAAEAVIAHEGPIHPERLARLVAASFDLSRLNATRIDAIVGTVPRDLKPKDGEGFLWPRGLDPSSWDMFRAADPATPRPLDQVSLREIGNAMVALCIAGAGVETSELLRDTLGVFGGKRLTPSIAGRLEAALAKAVDQGRLVTDTGGRVRAVPVP